MNYNIECCDPFDGIHENFWMKVEHCGRYIWACDYLKNTNCKMIGDFACGNGYGSKILSEYFDKIVSMDKSNIFLSDAMKKNFASNIIYQQCDFDACDSTVLPFRLDAIVSFETIEHVRHPEHLLDWFYDVLKPNGVLLLSLPNNLFELFDKENNNLDRFHLHVFMPEKIQKMLEDAGFVINQILGQDISNRIVNRIKQLDTTTRYNGLICETTDNDVYTDENLWYMSSLFGYPDSIAVQESYSHIYCCVKDCVSSGE